MFFAHQGFLPVKAFFRSLFLLPGAGKQSVTAQKSLYSTTPADGSPQHLYAALRGERSSLLHSVFLGRLLQPSVGSWTFSFRLALRAQLINLPPRESSQPAWQAG